MSATLKMLKGPLLNTWHNLKHDTTSNLNVFKNDHPTFGVDDLEADR